MALVLLVRGCAHVAGPLVPTPAHDVLVLLVHPPGVGVLGGGRLGAWEHARSGAYSVSGGFDGGAGRSGPLEDAVGVLRRGNGGGASWRETWGTFGVRRSGAYFPPFDTPDQNGIPGGLDGFPAPVPSASLTYQRYPAPHAVLLFACEPCSLAPRRSRPRRRARPRAPGRWWAWEKKDEQVRA